MQIALFMPCLADQFDPRTGIAVTKILEHLGHDVRFPAGQTCCGQPMHNAGLHDDARGIARRMIEVFAPYETIVTPSGSCAGMVRTHFPQLLPDDAAARELGRRTHEFIELLDTVLGVDIGGLPGRWPGTATYHDACHLREIDRHGCAESSLSRIDGLTLVPLEKGEQCCGFGGAFSVKHATISADLARDKVEAIRASGVDTVICNETGCTMSIEGACRRASVQARFVSTAEVLAEAMGLLERPRPEQPRTASATAGRFRGNGGSRGAGGDGGGRGDGGGGAFDV